MESMEQKRTVDLVIGWGYLFLFCSVDFLVFGSPETKKGPSIHIVLYVSFRPPP